MIHASQVIIDNLRTQGFSFYYDPETDAVHVKEENAASFCKITSVLTVRLGLLKPLLGKLPVPEVLPIIGKG